MITEARERGLTGNSRCLDPELTALTDENVNGFNNDFHMIPPLRSQLDRAGLIQGLLRIASKRSVLTTSHMNVRQKKRHLQILNQA